MLDQEWSKFLGLTEDDDQQQQQQQQQLQQEQPILSQKVLSTEIPSLQISPLYISTKTTIIYLNRAIDLTTMFWDLILIPYSSPKEGIVKKQMKFNSHSLDDYTRLQSQLGTERLKGFRLQEDIITTTSGNRVQFKDIRKISVGLSTKDCVTKYRAKSAFYNCFVIILRIWIKLGCFKEYHIKVFNTGKMEIPGLQSDEEFEFLLVKLVKVLKTYDADIEASDKPSDTILINSNFKTGFYINRDTLYDILQREYRFQCVYDPCSYPGIQCKFYYYKDREIQTGVQDYDDIKGKGYGYKKTKKDAANVDSLEQAAVLLPTKMQNRKTSKFSEISIMIFRTGSILIVGMCSETVLYDVYHFIRQIMEKEYARIKQTIQEPEINISKKKKNKKLKVRIQL